MAKRQQDPEITTDHEHGPSCVHTSPSQIEAARRCMRRWWWQTIKGFKEPDSPATLFGTDVHAALEHYVQHRVWPPVDTRTLEVARAAWNALIQHLGHSTLGPTEIEVPWRMLASGDYPLLSRGRIDLTMLSRRVLLDWKTSSNFKYIKSPETLAEDPQVILYGDAMVKAGKLQLPAQFWHVYTLTKGDVPEGRVVVTKLDAAMLANGRAGIRKTMIEMKAIAALVDPNPEDIPANILACRDFNGCSHFDRCFVKTQTKEQEARNMSEIQDKFAARRAALAGKTAPAPTPAPTPIPEKVPAKDGPKFLTLEEMKATVIERKAAFEAALAKVNPPDASPPAMSSMSATGDDIAPSDEPPVGWDAAPAKKPRSKKVKDPAPEAPTSNPPVADVITLTPPEVHSEVDPNPTKPGAVLCIGCGPMLGSEEFVLADEWLLPFADRVAAQFRVPYWSLVDFGKGKAAIVALVAEAAARGDVPPRLVIDRRSTLGDAVVEILLTKYEHVFVKLG